MDLNNVGFSHVTPKISDKKQEAEKPVQDEQTQRPQAKEHCSSKAGKAVRGMMLGLALAAGVSIGAKAMPVQAASSQPADNGINVMQEMEENVQKTDMEKAVDELMAETESTTTTLHVGDKNTCHGQMSRSELFGGRNYDKAAIEKDGTLVFYKEYTHYHDDYTSYSYSQKNSFNLNTETEGSKIQLQTGSRFEETNNVNGDYVVLADDGRTFCVYNKDGEEIGYVEADTPETHKTEVIAGVIAATVMGGIYFGLKAKEEFG